MLKVQFKLQKTDFLTCSSGKSYNVDTFGFICLLLEILNICLHPNMMDYDGWWM